MRRCRVTPLVGGFGHDVWCWARGAGNISHAARRQPKTLESQRQIVAYKHQKTTTAPLRSLLDENSLYPFEKRRLNTPSTPSVLVISSKEAPAVSLAPAPSAAQPHHRRSREHHHHRRFEACKHPTTAISPIQDAAKTAKHTRSEPSRERQ